VLRHTFNTLQTMDDGDLQKNADRLVEVSSEETTSAYRATFGNGSVCQSKQPTFEMVLHALELMGAAKTNLAILLMLRSIVKGMFRESYD
jgi:hypothetical protein